MIRWQPPWLQRQGQQRPSWDAHWPRSWTSATSPRGQLTLFTEFSASRCTGVQRWTLDSVEKGALQLANLLDVPSMIRAPVQTVVLLAFVRGIRCSWPPVRNSTATAAILLPQHHSPPWLPLWWSTASHWLQVTAGQLIVCHTNPRYAHSSRAAEARFRAPALHHLLCLFASNRSPGPIPNNTIGKSSIRPEDGQRAPTEVELQPGDVEALSLRRPLFRAVRIFKVDLYYLIRDCSIIRLLKYCS